MTVNQAYELLNTKIIPEVLGTSEIVVENLDSYISLGKEILSSSDNIDKYVKSLVNHIGRVQVVARAYEGYAPKLLVDAWRFGSIKEKINIEMPDFSINKTWELNNNEEYRQDIFKAPTVTAKFFNERVAFEIDNSYSYETVEQSFSDETQMLTFFAGIEMAIKNAFSVALDSLSMRLINMMIAQTFKAEFGEETDYTTDSKTKAVNLLKLYNTRFAPATPLTAENCLHNTEFLKFASSQMTMYIDRLKGMSTLFNIGGKERHTPTDRLHVVLLSEFVRSSDTYLQADTFHDIYTQLPNHDTIPYWQGSGTDYSFGSVSEIHVNTDNTEIAVSGILGVMFDEEACVIANMNEKVTVHYNASGDFYNYYYKRYVEFLADTNENFIVFYVA